MTQEHSLRRKIRAKVLPYILWIFAHLPLKFLYRISSTVAWILYRTPNQIKQIAETNIHLCFPEKNEQEKQILLKNTLKHNVATIFELSFMWLKDMETIKKHIKEVQHDEYFESDLKAYDQMIFITPHLGSWELSGLYASSLYPLATLYRPSRLGIDDLIIKGRGKNGAILVATTAKGIREMMRAMKEGRSVGILPDQDPGTGEGIFSTFFDIQTNTIVLVSRLAQRFQIPTYLVTTTRNMKDATFTIQVTKINDAIQDSDIQKSVDTLNQAIETAIKKTPEQYLWTYKRFKTAPQGEAPRY